ncbi:hypothetical protein [Bradyrhizobium sp. SSUT77]|uniref:hypothetical protein n=1 Tax=Bradyrhizobium sp. SSUT77 TaxID=3040603 RepID=UPI00244BEBD3|nr:hypothetical protein [Bradyrhizobium sp. SSUT77]MDH2341392.1 hypothetical protein [Bradyrhizobium sp. SSUT77]
MSRNLPEITAARRQILDAAKQVLSRATTAIEAARIIARCRFEAKLEDDPDILPFVGIDSETDALPLGHDQIHWQARALADLQPKIEEAETWAREFAVSHCQNLVSREAALLRWPD